ncbi:hypothetical protein [Carnimonas bestiolae]|uniref:hypothetical protein n=1 Tax=Carnimonas bestiolae TaxID=3402172 RepID=UPI003EDB6C24
MKPLTSRPGSHEPRRYAIELSDDELLKLRLGIAVTYCDTNDYAKPGLDSLLDKLNTLAPSAEPDLMTVAYLALGARQSDNFKAVCDRHGLCEDGLIDWVITYAGFVDAIYAEPDVQDYWHGVWVHDVAEPLGQWMIDHFEACQTVMYQHHPALKQARWLINQQLDENTQSLQK